MNNQPAEKEEDVLPLKALIKSGKLAEIQEWMVSGKPVLLPPGSKKRSALELAAEVGFFSVVELLAKDWPDKKEVNRALVRALQKRQPHIAKLLVDLGADPNRPDIEDVAGCVDKDLMQFFLELSLPKTSSGLKQEWRRSMDHTH